MSLQMQAQFTCGAERYDPNRKKWDRAGMKQMTQGVELEALRWDESGLIAGIVQHAVSGEVRMLGYLNRESLEMTISSGFVHFFSRSRQKLWKKGETSGNLLEVVDITADCDGDVLLIRALPHGPTCHTGAETCFFAGPLHHNPLADVPASSRVVDDVARVVAARRRELPDGSYTSYLLREGVDKIGKKIGEESAEVIIAAKNGEPGPLAQESADLIYHLLVLLEACDVPLDSVWTVLSERRGSTGTAGSPGRRESGTP
jgi:phosphoribosyl-ATP pyrophosphohydrolase/phosphoribosyl-AMP cyclohydrolase